MAWIWQSPTFPGSLCSSHAELSFKTNSWACVLVYQLGSYLVFLSQLASAPLGVLFAWEHKGSPGARPQTLYTVYVFSLKHLLPGVVALYRGIAPMCPCVLYLYPSFSGILTVNSWHLMQTADWKTTTTKKKQGQPQSTVANVRMCVRTPNKQVCTTTQWSSAGNTFMSSLSLFSHIHLQAQLIQVASVCLTYQKATSAETQWSRGYSCIWQFRHPVINVFRIMNL